MSRHATLPVLGSLLLALLVGCSGGSSPDSAPSTSATPDPPPLQATYDGCRNGAGGETLDLGDAGHTLVIDTQSETGPVDGLLCVVEGLDVSDAIIASMESTTAMMGVQDADQGDLHFQWSYHPDNGMNVVITDTSG